MGMHKHGSLRSCLLLRRRRGWWLDAMRRTERGEFLGCAYFAVLRPGYPTHTCRTRRPVRVNGHIPMHDTDIAHRAGSRSGQRGRRRGHHGIRGCASLAAEKCWTPPSRTGAGDRVNAFVVRVTTMAPHVLPAHTRMAQTLQRHPQVTIFDRGVRGRYPTTPMPGRQPFGKSVDDVSTISEKRYLGIRVEEL